MSESNDYQTFKRNVPGPRDRLDRIENVVVNGMPDINMCIEGVELWIELKSPTEPKRATTRLFGSNHKLSVDQKNWFLRHRTAKGFAYILIATDKRWILINGKDADLVNDLTVLQLLELSIWCASKPVRSWEDLRNILRLDYKAWRQ